MQCQDGYSNAVLDGLRNDVLELRGCSAGVASVAKLGRIAEAYIVR
jgi:hypothetical protein